VRDVIGVAVTSLGLGDVAPFDVEKKVLGLPAVPEGALVRRPVLDFTDEVSRDSPAPGGGSVAALAGALGAALASMVANLTHGKEGTEARDADLARIAEEAQRIKDRLVAAIDADADAFGAFMEATRLPQGTPEEKAARAQKMQEGLQAAVKVPWDTAALSFEAMKLARAVLALGNPASLSDGAVGVQIAYAGVRGGLWNVLINLKDVTDAGYVSDKQEASARLLGTARALAEEAGAHVDERLLSMIAGGKR
jgi:glutamate formiminotransferase/formiminotetrahydrofolate cyclodeaminase